MEQALAGGAPPPTWTDYLGRQWPVVQSRHRLKFSYYPAHAALRAHVYHRDGYACVRCDAKAVSVPAHYDGKQALLTDTTVCSGFPDVLVLDHIKSLRAGGASVVDNLQTLCETCNRRKVAEDRKAVAVTREVR